MYPVHSVTHVSAGQVGVMDRKTADHAKVSSRQTSLARVMRRKMTEPEGKLWKALRWLLAIEATHFRR
jgi:very-short-patch-repair endonuclease